MNGWMDGQLDGRLDLCMVDGWMDVRMVDGCGTKGVFTKSRATVLCESAVGRWQVELIRWIRRKQAAAD